MREIASVFYLIGIAKVFGKMGIVVVAYKCRALCAVVQKQLETVNTGVVLENVHVDVEAEVNKTAQNTSVD